jgi:SAM-dependent methyltransferase
LSLIKFKNKISKVFDIYKVSTKPAFCIKPDYRHRKTPNYIDKTHIRGDTIWQPEVYPLGKTLSRFCKCKSVIDIGCGDGTKIVPFYPEFNIIGIDYEKNLAKCQQTYSFGKWIEWNLEKPNPPNLSQDLLKNSSLICSDVIEHLKNPSILLQNLKKFLELSPLCIISTPERDLIRGTDHMGPPPNPNHVREWNISEFRKLLESYDFNIAFMGLTASDNKTYEQKTIIACLQNNYSNDSIKTEILNRKYTSIF